MIDRAKQYQIVCRVLNQMVGQLDWVSGKPLRNRGNLLEEKFNKIISKTAGWICEYIRPVETDDMISNIRTWIENNVYNDEVDFEGLCRIINAES